MSVQNIERNKRMVLLRFNDPATYSAEKLGKLEGIKKQTAHVILHRDWSKYLTKRQLKKRPKP